MTTNRWLDTRRQELIPAESERREVQSAVDDVCSTLRADWRIAEVYPCGSAAKGTMLRGRKEADVVLVMRDAPVPQTLEYFRSLLAAGAGVRAVTIRHKAVCVEFQNGVSVDVLPAASEGMTEPGGSIPGKHRRAMDGRKHVEWFQREGHATGAHDVVRLTKHWRDVQGLSEILCSFGLEVLTVEVLRAAGGGSLENRFTHVLEGLAQRRAQVQDPARPSQWVNNLTPSEQDRVCRAARASLEHLRQGNPSLAFAGRSYPGGLSGLGGAPLA